MTDLTARITEILTKECSQTPRLWRDHATALIAEAAEQYYRPRVETVEQLDALPNLVVIQDAAETVWERNSTVGPSDEWWCTGSECEYPPSAIQLPAVVLYLPEGADE